HPGGPARAAEPFISPRSPSSTHSPRACRLLALDGERTARRSCRRWLRLWLWLRIPLLSVLPVLQPVVRLGSLSISVSTVRLRVSDGRCAERFHQARSHAKDGRSLRGWLSGGRR